MKLLWKYKRGLSSREVWNGIPRERSRTSVLIFLEEMVLYGLVRKHIITDKGGHRGIYESVYDEQETKEYLKGLFKQRLDQL